MSYANAVLNALDPEGNLINYRLFRDRCILKEGCYLKDLGILKNRDLRNVVIVDNSIISFSKHLSNGIHVQSYFGQSNDTSLLYLIPFLESIAQVNDIPAELDKKHGLNTLFRWYTKRTEDQNDNTESSLQ